MIHLIPGLTLLWMLIGGLITGNIFVRREFQGGYKRGFIVGCLIGGIGGIILLILFWLWLPTWYRKCPTCGYHNRIRWLYCRHCLTIFTPLLPINKPRLIDGFRFRIKWYLSIIRPVLPPWENLNHPLIQYGIKKGQRARNSRFTFSRYMNWLNLPLLIGGGFGVGGFWLYGYDFRRAIFAMMTGLGGYIIFAGIVLTVEILARSTRLLVERRQRGDLDLILITPLPRSQWLRSQMTIIGWQVWPLVKELWITGGILAFLWFGIHDWGEIGLLFVLPVLLFLVFQPILHLAIVTAIGLYSAAHPHTRNAGVAMAWSLMRVMVIYPFTAIVLLAKTAVLLSVMIYVIMIWMSVSRWVLKINGLFLPGGILLDAWTWGLYHRPEYTLAFTAWLMLVAWLMFYVLHLLGNHVDLMGKAIKMLNQRAD